MRAFKVNPVFRQASIFANPKYLSKSMNLDRIIFDSRLYDPCRAHMNFCYSQNDLKDSTHMIQHAPFSYKNMGNSLKGY